MGSPEPGCRTAAPAVVDLLLGRSPTLGSVRLLCVDGPSGSGKTTLAAEAVAELEARGRTVAVVPMDDLYDGWGGLPGSGAFLREHVLEPVADGRPGAYRRYDWHRARRADERTVPVADVLVVEGVGSWRREHAGLVTVLVWVDAPRAQRLERALRRDGPHLEAELRQWHVEEDALHAEEGTKDRADLVVRG